MPVQTPALAQTLLDRGELSHEDLATAHKLQETAWQPLERIMVSEGMITDDQLAAALAETQSLDLVDLDEQPPDPVAASLIPEELARRHAVLPVGLDDHGVLRLAMSDPRNVIAIDDVRTVTGRSVVPVVATRAGILAAIDAVSRGFERVDNDDDADEAVEDTAVAVTGAGDEAPIVRFVNSVLQQAVRAGASDIHIEPAETHVRVRFRVDGVLHEVTTQSRTIHSGVVSRLKIMADLDIAERRVPQDGRISIRTRDKGIDLRVSTLPTVHGEKVVMRILDKAAIRLQLSDLGFLPHNYERYERYFTKPYGMILVTGPTGSGKSTTLYATLNVISSPDVNVVTTEDPVEYRLSGINQVQISHRAGLTFPKALRAILRQDPDVVLVGEMRDHETAKIGMEAALTGHLVLSTLHTNDAPSAVTRLTEMGIETFLVASAVDCVLAQRLARRLCTRCREPFSPSADELRAAGLDWRSGDALPTLYRPVGCTQCARTGYRGRLAVHEIMEVDETIERLIVGGASTDRIADAARERGMRTLREDGLAKVLMGHTTLEEVARVVA